MGLVGTINYPLGGHDGSIPNSWDVVHSYCNAESVLYNRVGMFHYCDGTLHICVLNTESRVMSLMPTLEGSLSRVDVCELGPLDQ